MMTQPDRGTTIAVLQPSYLPWLGYFDQMRRATLFVLYDDVQFDKHGWRNRNRIKTPQGPLWLTVPVLQHGADRPPINEVRIDSRSPWRRKHVNSLRQYYARAPYASAYLPALEEIIAREWERLVDLNLAVISLMATWLRVSTPVVLSSALPADGERSGRLVNICRHFNADCYLSGDSAQDYLDRSLFAAAGIDVEWQSYRHPVYPQLHGAFLSHLSAIDLILNCGPESADILAGSPGHPGGAAGADFHRVHKD